MPTVIRIDLRSSPPYYEIVSRDPDRVVSAPAPGLPGALPSGSFSYGNDLPATRQNIFDSLARGRQDTFDALAFARQQIFDNAGSAAVLANLAKARREIVRDVSGQGILDDLQRERDTIFADIRGDNPGPILVLRNVAINTSASDILKAQAARESDPLTRERLLFLADLEYVYAAAMRDAQQVVHDAVMNGADWIFGDAYYTHAIARRAQMESAAAMVYNLALPWWARLAGYAKSLSRGL